MEKKEEKDEKLTGAISWIIMHTFMKGEVKRLNSMINQEDIEKLKMLNDQVDELSKKFDASMLKDKRKIETEHRIERSKIISKNWLIQNKRTNKELAGHGNKKDEADIWGTLFQNAIEESSFEGSQLEELEEKIIYFIKAAKLVTIRQKCSISILSDELKINKNNIYYLLNKLQDVGIIMDIYGKRNPKVLIENLEMLEAILTATDLNELFFDGMSQGEGSNLV
jgi:hypothetical protein